MFLHDTTTGVTTLVTRNAQGGSATAAARPGDQRERQVPGLRLLGDQPRRRRQPAGIRRRVHLPLHHRQRPHQAGLEVTERHAAGVDPSKRPSAPSAATSPTAPAPTTSSPATTTAAGTRSATTPRGRDHQGQPDPRRSGDRQVLLRHRDQRQRAVRRLADEGHEHGPADTNNDEDAYVFDVETGTNTLISHDSSGLAVGGRPTGISDNGKIVALTSTPTRSHPATPTTTTDAFVYSAATDKVTLITAARPEWPDDVRPAPPRSRPTAATSPTSRSRSTTSRRRRCSSTTGRRGSRRLSPSLPTARPPTAAAARRASAVPGTSSASARLPPTWCPGDPHDNCDIFLWSRS